MKKRISDMMDCIESPDVELNQQTPLSSQRIKELTMNNINNRRKPRRTGFRVLVAVAVIATLTATVFAAGNMAGWFRQYFEKQNDAPLSPGQIEYLEEKEQAIVETQVANGWTVELKSVLSGGNTTYVTVGVTAPENIDLNAMDLHFGKGIDIFDQQNQPPFSYWFSKEDDLDGLSNTANLVMIFEPGHWNTGSVWNIQISALHQMIYDAEYEEELLQTKYAGQTDVMFTSEESERIHQYPVVVEGPWSFAIDLSASDGEELEMISEPVRIQAEVQRRGSDDITSDDYFIDAVEEVSIVSFVLTPLNATVRFECAAEDTFVDASAWDLYVVMKDGSQIELQRGSSEGCVSKYLAATPIVLAEVDHILLPDGTKIIAP